MHVDMGSVYMHGSLGDLLKDEAMSKSNQKSIAE